MLSKGPTFPPQLDHLPFDCGSCGEHARGSSPPLPQVREALRILCVQPDRRGPGGVLPAREGGCQKSQRGVGPGSLRGKGDAQPSSRTVPGLFAKLAGRVRSSSACPTNPFCSTCHPQVCIQAGLPPSMAPDLYPSLVRAIKAEVPAIHVHAFSPEEVSKAEGRYSYQPANTLVVQGSILHASGQF